MHGGTGGQLVLQPIRTDFEAKFLLCRLARPCPPTLRNRGPPSDFSRSMLMYVACGAAAFWPVSVPVLDPVLDQG